MRTQRGKKFTIAVKGKWKGRMLIAACAKHFHEIASAPAEHEEIAGVRIALQRLPAPGGPGHSCRGACRYGLSQSTPYTRGYGNHRRGIAFITAAARSGLTAPEMRKRTPRPNSSSISGMVAGTAAEVGSSLCSGPAIATGVKPIGVDVGATHFSVSRYCYLDIFLGSGAAMVPCSSKDPVIGGYYSI
jgi:hypothetical protein